MVLGMSSKKKKESGVIQNDSGSSWESATQKSKGTVKSSKSTTKTKPKLIPKKTSSKSGRRASLGGDLEKSKSDRRASSGGDLEKLMMMKEKPKQLRVLAPTYHTINFDDNVAKAKTEEAPKRRRSAGPLLTRAKSEKDVTSSPGPLRRKPAFERSSSERHRNMFYEKSPTRSKSPGRLATIPQSPGRLSKAGKSPGRSKSPRALAETSNRSKRNKSPGRLSSAIPPPPMDLAAVPQSPGRLSRRNKLPGRLADTSSHSKRSKSPGRLADTSSHSKRSKSPGRLRSINPQSPGRLVRKTKRIALVPPAPTDSPKSPRSLRKSKSLPSPQQSESKKKLVPLMLMEEEEDLAAKRMATKKLKIAEDQMAIQQKRNEIIAKQFRVLEEQFKSLQEKHSDLQQEHRVSLKNHSKEIIDKDKEIKDLNKTVERVMEFQTSNDIGVSNRSDNKNSRARNDYLIQGQLLLEQNKVTALQKTVATLEEEKGKMAKELKSYRGVGGEETQQEKNFKLQEENEDQKNKMKFKDDTIQHLMEQLKTLKLASSNIDGSSAHRETAPKPQTGPQKSPGSLLANTWASLSPGALRGRRGVARGKGNHGMSMPTL